MYRERLGLYHQIESVRKSKLLVCFTSDRNQLETQLSSEFINIFVRHLDAMGQVEKLTVLFHTAGGDCLSAWSLVNLLMQYCHSFEVMVVSHAHSAGTLFCLGADGIIMTRQATLSSIDPSINHPLNPPIPGAPPNIKVPIGVESIYGYLEFARQFLDKEEDMGEAFKALSTAVHPIVLGQVFQAHGQVRMLLRRLLEKKGRSEEDIQSIVNLLSSESGSHFVTINRQEAREELKLPIEEPDAELYELIKRVYENISFEMELGVPFNPFIMLGADSNCEYNFVRALVESVEGFSDAFVSEGRLVRQMVQGPPGMPPPMGFGDMRTFEGWRRQTN